METSKYQAEDIPKYIERYLKKIEKQKKRVSRSDLKKGMVVIVLEGEFEGKRVVFLKKLENSLALCTGPANVNGVPLFKIDEKYLLATSTIIPIKSEIDVNESDVILSEKNSKVERMDVECSGETEKIDNEIAQEIKKVEFLKAYMNQDFEIDSSVEFYSQKY